MGWTLGSAQMLRALQSAIRVVHPTHVRLLPKFWNQDPPDLVVSLIPNFNRALREGSRQARPGAPYVTILTDLADYPPHFWIEPQNNGSFAAPGRQPGRRARSGPGKIASGAPRG